MTAIGVRVAGTRRRRRGSSDPAGGRGRRVRGARRASSRSVRRSRRVAALPTRSRRKYSWARRTWPWRTTSIFSIRGLWILNVRSTPTPRRDPADRDRAGDAAAAEAHDGALEDLDALAVALDDLGRDLDGVARGELGEVGAELVVDDLVEHVHAGGSLVGRRQPKLRVGGHGDGRNGRPAAEYSTGRVRPDAGGDVPWRRGPGASARRSAASRSGRRSRVRPRACSSPPAGDRAVVARGQDRRHVHAAERRRAGVLRVLEQPGGERLLGRRERRRSRPAAAG